MALAGQDKDRSLTALGMDQGMDRLRMHFSITDAAKDERAAAFGSAVSIRIHVEGVAMAGRGSHFCCSISQGNSWREHDINTHNEGYVAVTILQ